MDLSQRLLASQTFIFFSSSILLRKESYNLTWEQWGCQTNTCTHTNTHTDEREVVPFPFQQEKSKSRRSDLLLVNSHPPKCFSRRHIHRWSQGKKYNYSHQHPSVGMQCRFFFFLFFLTLSFHGCKPHLTDQTRSGCWSRAELSQHFAVSLQQSDADTW